MVVVDMVVVVNITVVVVVIARQDFQVSLVEKELQAEKTVKTDIHSLHHHHPGALPAG